jgi:hypothetical protein
VTLVTSADFVIGAQVLAVSLRKVGAKRPLGRVHVPSPALAQL